MIICFSQTTRYYKMALLRAEHHPYLSGECHLKLLVSKVIIVRLWFKNE